MLSNHNTVLIKKGHELKKQQCIQRRIIESLKHQGLRLGKILKNQ
jgi:hypothetical protein